MSCEICGRGSCTRSFHSIEAQEEFDNRKAYEANGQCYDCDALAQENAMLKKLITDLGNEYLIVNDDGSFFGALSNRVNKALGI